MLEESSLDELIGRLLKGIATADEEKQVTRWRALSSENERRFQELVELYSVLASVETPYATPPSAQVLAQRAGPRAELPMASAPPRTRRWLTLATAAAAVLIVASGLAIRRRDPAPLRTPIEHVVTGESETTTVPLLDGTVIRLAPHSRLGITDGGRTRQVTLEGRAYFAVAKQTGRNFRVHTSAGDAVVLGTRFELITDHQNLQVIVVEGRVALERANQRVEVSAGKTARLVAGEALPPVAATQLSEVGKWVGRFLVFQSTPMREVVSTLEREYGVRIQIRDSALAGLTYTGTYSNSTFSDVFEVLCSVLDADCAVHGDSAIITARAERR